MMHVYDWLDLPPADRGEEIAKRFLDEATKPAIDKNYAWLEENPLFCTYQGQRYRCTGASSLGDVWLAKDMNRTAGYDLRVEVTECSEWGNVQ